MSTLDSNILIHATSSTSELNARAKTAIIKLAIPSRVTVPRQVLREYLSVMTGRGFNSKPITMAKAMAVDLFQHRFKVLEDGPLVWDEFTRLSRSFSFAGKQVHDANIVATMLAHGETKLLTFNTKDVRRFEPLIELVEP